MNEKFHSSTSDIKFRSTDGIEFDLHRTLLEGNTGAFPGPEMDTRGEVIQLTETGKVLAILFDFVYPRRHPDLEDKDFELVAAVAEAVGKYEVYSAMNTCNTRLRSFLPVHATEIFIYAMKHDHLKLANQAAPYLARAPLIPVLQKLPICYILLWTRYHEAWSSVLKEARLYIKSMPMATPLTLCHSGSAVCTTCRSSLYTWVTTLEELDTVFALNSALRTARFMDAGFSCCKVLAIRNSHQPSPFSIPPPTLKQDHKCDHMVDLAKICDDKVQAIPPFSIFMGGNQ